MQKYAREPISLHTPLGEEGDSEFGDLIEDAEAIQPAEAATSTLMQEQNGTHARHAVRSRSGILSMRFGLTDGQAKTLDEVGKVYGVTREGSGRETESKAMSKLRHPVPVPAPLRLPGLIPARRRAAAPGALHWSGGRRSRAGPAGRSGRGAVQL